MQPFIQKTREAVAVSGICSGVPEENSGGIAVKIAGEILLASQNAFNSRNSGTGKGKPAANLGPTLPGTLS